MKNLKGFYSDNKGNLYGTGDNPKKEFIENQIANEIMENNDIIENLKTMETEKNLKNKASEKFNRDFSN